ncbi:MAG: DctP family TRAP transporter solute-binding subunit [Synergistaceae bacterium]|jgi:tripartite ATP-independent transporter DctP family solute receptor|nr:DctP family TRAP transporter solute-binding subunit [Synergistaceae bacterium]
MRKFFRILMFSVLVAMMITVSMPAMAASTKGDVITLTFAHHQQPDSPAGLGAQRLADRLIRAGGGRLDVKVYPAEQLGNEKSVFEQLGTGVVDMSTFGFGIIGTLSPSALATEMGYMFENYEHLAAFLESDVFAGIVEEAAAKAGARIGGAYYNGVRHTTTSGKRFTDPASLAGVKIRVPNSEMLLATFSAMGAAPTPMAFSEVYMALQNGTIDGEENPIPTIMSMRFYEVQKYLILTGHNVQSATFTVSEKTYRSLPDDLKKIVLDEMKAEALETTKDVKQKEIDQLAELRKLGMEVVEVDVSAFAKKVKEIIPTFEQQWGVGLYDKIQGTNPGK